MPLLAATVITSNREGIIGDALRSALGFVDGVVLIDLGITDGTLEVARKICGDKLHLVHYPGVEEDHPFATIRNFALDAAARAGFRWAMTLDTDERIHVQFNWQLRPLLRKTPFDMIEMNRFDGQNQKERFFRLPCRGRWTGRAHENMEGIPHEKKCIVREMVFEELPKSKDRITRDAVLILEAVCQEIQDNPTNPRWHWYAADSLYVLGRLEEATEEYVQVLRTAPPGTNLYQWALDRLSNIEHGLALC